jgi:hypothetical protein
MKHCLSYVLFLNILQYIMWEAYIKSCRCCMGFITAAAELAVEKQDKHPGWIHLGCQMELQNTCTAGIRNSLCFSTT